MSFIDTYICALILMRLANLLNRSFPPIAEWAEQNHLKIAPAKSSVTLFTPWNRQFQAHPRVLLNDTVLPLERNPKILGVRLDPSLTFTPHVKEIAHKCNSRLNILKALSGTSWGHQKETLAVTYGALIKPVMTYAAPVWYPSTCASNIRTLQSVQSKALRVICGSHKMANLHHLHAETKTLPVREELDLLCKQYLASSLRTAHPSHQQVISEPGPRADRRVGTLRSKFLPSIQHLLTNGITPPSDYKCILKELHTSSVQSYLHSAPPNKVLLAPPPAIADEETRLPRHFRTTLSQLRSGYCARLNGYRQRIGLTSSDLCLECELAPHTVSHLFSCQSHPTLLSPEDLWLRPVEVASLLGNMTAFDGLPPLEPPVPPPPPG